MLQLVAVFYFSNPQIVLSFLFPCNLFSEKNWWSGLHFPIEIWRQMSMKDKKGRNRFRGIPLDCDDTCVCVWGGGRRGEADRGGESLSRGCLSDKRFAYLCWEFQRKDCPLGVLPWTEMAKSQHFQSWAVEYSNCPNSRFLDQWEPLQVDFSESFDLSAISDSFLSLMARYSRLILNVSCLRCGINAIIKEA